MKVVHFDSGFGNQISIYAEYLAMRHANPGEDVYMEDIVYSIPETDEFLAMWQGYELEKVFGIRIPNISDFFSEMEYQQIVEEVRETEFWNDGWNYPPAITGVLERHGMKLKSLCKSNFISDEGAAKAFLRKLLKDMRRTHAGSSMLRFCMRLGEKFLLAWHNYKKELFLESDEDLFFGQTGYPLYRTAGLELIEDQLRSDLKFHVTVSGKNKAVLEKIEKCNSVSIHARRGDLLTHVDFCYSNGYFGRAADFIRKKTEKPVFFVFSDEGSEKWIMENRKVLGIGYNDDVNVINWNKGDDSYIDMYLMSRCRHNIFTKSSFGFWAAWINENPNKITCSPDIRLNSTHHF